MADLTNTKTSSLHLTIRSRVDKLKQQCHDVYGDIGNGQVKRASKSGTTTVPHLHEFFSSVQLWKERSLHHTLAALDKAGASSVDSHIEAMEHHEKAAKDLFELTRGVLDRSLQDLDLYLAAFTEDLAGLVDEIVASKLEEQRLVHDNVVTGLKEENQQLARTYQVLQGTNAELEDRLEVLENTPDAGGDAVLCNKLRRRVQHLVIRQRELSTELERAALERVKHRRELDRTKTLLADSQKSLALTRAMHDKETRQLAALVQLNHAQALEVLEASRDAARHPHHQLERFDPLSGCMIVHLTPISTPQKPPGSPSTCSISPRRASSPVLTPSPTQKQHGEPRRQRIERPKSATLAGSRRRAFAATHGDKTPPPPTTKVFRGAQK